MKKILLICFLKMFLIINLLAQVHLKSGFHGSSLSGFYAGVEYKFSSNIGVELGSASNYSNTSLGTYLGSGLLLSARYYFKPTADIDKLFLGAYLRPYLGYTDENFSSGFRVTQSAKVSGLGMGVMVGRKFSINKNIFFEVTAGIGGNYSKVVYEDPNSRRFTNLPFNDGLFNILLGYRL